MKPLNPLLIINDRAEMASFDEADLYCRGTYSRSNLSRWWRHRGCPPVFEYYGQTIRMLRDPKRGRQKNDPGALRIYSYEINGNYYGNLRRMADELNMSYVDFIAVFDRTEPIQTINGHEVKKVGRRWIRPENSPNEYETSESQPLREMTYKKIIGNHEMTYSIMTGQLMHTRAI